MFLDYVFLGILTLWFITVAYHVYIHLKLIKMRRDWSKLRDQSVGFYNRPPWRRSPHFDKNQK